LAYRPVCKTTFGLFGLALLLNGCGFAEYEAKMVSEQARIHRIDLENKYLEDPIEWPAKKEADKKETDKKETDKKEVDKNYVDVFLRPPRGIDRKPLQQQRGMLHEFPRSKDGKDPIIAIWIGTAVNQPEFANDVEKLFGRKNLPSNHVVRQVPGRDKPLEFDLVMFDDANSTYLLCMYKRGDAQAAVVFHLAEKMSKLVVFSDDERGDNELTTKLRLSLESLGVDQEAGKLRATFNRYHPKSRAK
jgi:hypothetical protein